MGYAVNAGYFVGVIFSGCLKKVTVIASLEQSSRRGNLLTMKNGITKNFSAIFVTHSTLALFLLMVKKYLALIFDTLSYHE